MTKNGSVVYASGVRPRTDRIIRAFAAKNDLTLAQLMDILAHVVCAYDTMRLFSGKLGEYNPNFSRFDRLVRDYMETNTPEQYRKAPFIQRMFGTMFKPVTRRELEMIDKELEEEEKLPVIPEVTAE